MRRNLQPLSVYISTPHHEYELNYGICLTASCIVSANGLRHSKIAGNVGSRHRRAYKCASNIMFVLLPIVTIVPCCDDGGRVYGLVPRCNTVHTIGFVGLSVSALVACVVQTLVWPSATRKLSLFASFSSMVAYALPCLNPKGVWGWRALAEWSAIVSLVVCYTQPHRTEL